MQVHSEFQNILKLMFFISDLCMQVLHLAEADGEERRL
jgi:hypothetical protein